MKKRLLFSMIIVTAFISLTVSQSYSKLDVLREVDKLVDASKPNVLIIFSTGQFMSRGYNVGSGNPNTNTGDTDTSSRFYMVKDVLVDISGSFNGGVLDQTKDAINYGLMAYNQEDYFPYFTENCQDDAVTCSGDPDITKTTYQGYTFEENSVNYYYPDYSDFDNGELIDDDDGGKLWASIGNLTDVQAALALQNEGGVVIDGEANGDNRPGEVFRLTKDNTDSNNAYDYFKNVVINGDTPSKNGCFSKNYIIYIGDGFMNSGGKGLGAAKKHARELLLLTDGSTNTPVKTFVIGVIDKDNMSNQRSRLNSIAFHGGTDASDPTGNYGLNPMVDTDYLGDASSSDCIAVGTCYRTSTVDDHDYAFFVTDPEEIYDAFSNIADAIAAGDFVTGSPTATSSGGTFVTNNVGILASTEYPEWRGHLRAVDLVNDYFWWDAGATLFLSSCTGTEAESCIDALPKARANSDVAYVDAEPWRDTDGDGTTDQPPLIITEGGDTYVYTDRVLYCKTSDISDCKSSSLTANAFVGTTTNFIIDNTSTPYTYKGAFYLPPWKDRNIYASDLSGNLYDLYDSLSSDGTLLSLGGSDLGDWFGSLSDTTDKVNYAKAIINFALGGIDEDKDGAVDTGVDLNEDGDTGDTVNGIDEATTEVTREWRLGDITNVVPVGVGKPINPRDGLSGRGTYREDFVNRDSIVYTGSNDQMLHAFDFASGTELFAYIPPDLLPNLKTLYENAMDSTDNSAFMGQPANPTDHIYGLANSPKVNDVYFDSQWHTVLVTGEGPQGSSYVAGESHYFALDITHPRDDDDFRTSSDSMAASDLRYDSTDNSLDAPFKLLWHTKETSIASSYSSTLGETWSVPAFGRIQVASGTYKWVVFAGSGYDDTTYSDDKGEIFHIIDIEDGSLENSTNTTSNFQMGASSPVVTYGLLPDSVSIIKKDGSIVKNSYQADLNGRVYHIDTSSYTESTWDKTDITATMTSPPSAEKPFYYSPSIWDFDNESDSALNLMVLGSGAYDDPEMERQGDDDDGDGVDASDEVGDSLRNSSIAADLTSTLYFLLVNPTTPAAIDSFSIDMSAVNGTEVDEDGNLTGSDVIAGTLSKALIIASPVLFLNEVSDNTFELQALFLVFDPPDAGQLGCSFGNSYLLVFGLGSLDSIVNAGETGFASTSDITDTKAGKAKFVVSMGTGKVSGIGVAGGGSHVVVGQSGYGGGDTSGFNLAGADTWEPIGTIEKIFWKDTTY